MTSSPPWLNTPGVWLQNVAIDRPSRDGGHSGGPVQAVGWQNCSSGGRFPARAVFGHADKKQRAGGDPGSAVCTPQGTITANIEATVKNQGKSTADLSKITWQIILAGDWWAVSDNNAKYLEKYPPPQTVKPYVGGPMKLAYNQTWTGKMTIVGITKYKSIKGFTQPGSYVLQAAADPSKQIAESNEKNNDKRVTVKDPCFKLVR